MMNGLIRPAIAYGYLITMRNQLRPNLKVCPYCGFTMLGRFVPETRRTRFKRLITVYLFACPCGYHGYEVHTARIDANFTNLTYWHGGNEG